MSFDSGDGSNSPENGGQYTEGKAKIEHLSNLKISGPGSKSSGFLNSSQLLNRDITVMLLNTLRPKLYLDGFSATGIRAIRANLEADIRTVAVERNYRTYQILLSNLQENNVTAETYMDSFESVVSRFRFDFIDVDPYGSIVPYVDTALNYSTNNGYIGFTATDLSVLTGSIEEKNMRRYGSRMPNNSMRHEFGLRNLLGFIARRAASLDMGIIPEISFWHGHYYRVILKVKHGANAACATLDGVGTISPSAVDPLLQSSSYGPLWTGSMNSIFHDSTLNIPDSIGEISRNFAISLVNEDISALFLDATESMSRRKINLPSISDVISEAEGVGIVARRTHFSTTGIKSNNYGELLKIMAKSP